MQFEESHSSAEHLKSHLLNPESEDPIDLLLLEDNDIDAAVFIGAASRSKQKLVVRRANSLKEYTEELKQRPPQVICADHMLPDGSATEALTLRNQVCPNAPFIVITGAGEEQVAVEYMKAGAADYISKRQLDSFNQALEQVLRVNYNQSLRVLAEQETKRLNQELLALVGHVAEQQDEEKRRLSRDIHDQLGQELTALKLGLFWMEGRLKKPMDDTQLVLQKLGDLIELNSSIIVQVRNIARDLRPVVLDQVGLSAGIETLVRDFNRREQTFCGLHLTELPHLTEPLRTDLFRIVQEGLTNISRHAEAKLAYVRLSHINDALILELGDDGNGTDQQFDLGQISNGLGLVGIRERVRSHHGTMVVNSSLKRGTSIQIEIALNSPA